jgi:hypothetical protein
MRLLTSFSTVCVKNPATETGGVDAGGEVWMLKNWAARGSPYKSTV